MPAETQFRSGSVPRSTGTMEATTRQVIEEVLDTMFFSTAAAVECRHDAAAICSRVDFKGDSSGAFELTLGLEVARKFAAAFLGIDELELLPDAEVELSRELANMICGATLSRMHPDSVVKLQPPCLIRDSSRIPGMHQCFETPEGILSVTMRVN